MVHHQSLWPSERPEELTHLLIEQEVEPAECASLLPALLRLSEWQAPQPEPADTRRLIAALAQELPTLSPVRQAIREHLQHRVASLLATARAQVSLFGLGFWLLSAFVTLLGAAVVLARLIPDQELALRVSGPCLSYLGMIVAFRGKEARVLELELVCLPSPLQLTITRLVLVLGYDVGLSLALSLLFWTAGSAQVLALALAWFTPLLLVAGLALLLSLRLSVQIATSLAYGSWLTFLALSTFSPLRVLLVPALSILPGCIGLALLVLALVRMHAAMHYLLPHS
jgi:hypothetical protein